MKLRHFKIFCLLFFSSLVPGLAQDAIFNWMKYVQTETPYGDAQIILDREGAPWLVVKSFLGVNFSGTGSMGFQDYEGSGFYRLDSLGNMKNRFQISHSGGRFYCDAMATDEQNNLWIVGQAQDSLIINMSSGRKRIKFKGLKPVLAVFTSNGEFVRADTISVDNVREIFDIAFDKKNRAHLLMRSENYFSKKNILGEYVSISKHVLHHLLLDSAGNEISRREFKLGEMQGATMWNTSHISINESGYYIATQYHDTISTPEGVLVPYMPIESNNDVTYENHGVVMHFDLDGNFLWYKTVFGFSYQHITQLTSDTSGVYFAASFANECSLSDDNQITHYYEGGGELGYGVMLVSISNRGDIRWTDSHAVRKYFSGFLTCVGLELDQNEQLIAAFNFKDSLVVHAKNRRYDLKWSEKIGHTAFFMIYDQKGEVLKVRKDLDYKKGNTLLTDVRSIGNKFLVMGSYEPKYSGGVWNKQDGSHSPYTYDLDLSVQMHGAKDVRLPSHPTIFYKSLFVYCYNQKKVDDTPDKIDLIEPEPLKPDTMVLAWTEPVMLDSLWVNNPIDSMDVALNDEPDLTFDEYPVDNAQMVNSALDINLFPNPTRRNLNVRITGVKDFFSLTFYDERGNLLFTNSAYANSPEVNYEFDVSTYAGGIYLCVFVNGDGEVRTLRWIKVN